MKISKSVLLFGLFAAGIASADFVKGPYVQNVTTTTAVICWETNKSANASVEYRLAGERSPWHGPFSDAAAAQRHEVTLRGLQQARRYVYRLVDANGRVLAGGGFVAAPAAAVPFTFVVVGDTRSNPAIWRRVAQRIAAEKPQLCLHVGDIVTDGRQRAQWTEQFFAPARQLMACVPVFAAIGNHEAGPAENFRRFFSLPGNELWYSFDWAGVHFVALDSCAVGEQFEQMRRWAEKDLTASDARWKVVYFHHPMFTAGGHASHEAMREAFSELLARSGVDLVFTGHVHLYQRPKPIRHRYSAPGGAYVQIVTGGGAAPLVPLPDQSSLPPLFEKNLSVYHYVLVRVGSSRLEVTAKDIDGRVIDEFVIDKRPDAHRRLVQNAVDYEQLKLYWSLSRPRVRPWPLLLRPQVEAGGPFELAVTFNNPLREAIVVSAELSGNERWRVRPTVQTAGVAIKGRGGAKFAWRVWHTGNVRLGKLQLRLRVARSPFGSLAGKMLQLPIGVRRVVSARVIDKADAINVDGNLDEPAWSKAKVVGDFHDRYSPWAASPIATTVRVLAGVDGLYVALEAESSRTPQQLSAVAADAKLRQQDSVMVLIGTGADSYVVLRLDCGGTVKVIECSEHLAHEGVRGASRVGGRGWRGELFVPYVMFGKTAVPVRGNQWCFNVYRRNLPDGSRTILSPTFDDRMRPGNSAALVFE